MKTNNKNNIFSSLRGFLMLWASQSVSSMGTAMTEYALVVWGYGQTGSASSVTLLTLSTFLPTIQFRFIAGALADRWDKKRIMLLADFVAACGTAAIFVLHSTASLQLWHLYVINVLLSLMNAFQVPAAYVATSLLVPKEHYTRTGGLQTFSGALISILSPALGGVILAWGGLAAVLVIDLCTFAIAFVTLVFIPIPKPEKEKNAETESFWRNCLFGVRFLRERPRLFWMILYIAAVNFLAKLGPDGQMAAFILSRTGQNSTVLGLVQSSVAIGLMAGGALVTVMKPAANSIKAVFTSCAFIFLTGMGLSLSRGAAGWCLFACLQYLCAAVMNAHWGAYMRSEVPLPLQGRVFAARDTLQNCTIPLGLFLGGVLSDKFFSPLMQQNTKTAALLGPVLGTGNGAGIALLFFLISALGLMLTLLCMKRPLFRLSPDEAEK